MLGWPGIGYNYVCRQDGSVYYCGPIETLRYHVGSFNPIAVGIVLCGDFTEYEPTPVQLEGSVIAIADARARLGRNVAVVGHRELMTTSCPGNTWDDWKDFVI